jgi:hypothetical protein
VAVNILDDKFDVSPAIAGDELFFKGKIHLYCITQKSKKNEQNIIAETKRK